MAFSWRKKIVWSKFHLKWTHICIQSSTKVLYLTALVYYYWLKWKFISKIGAFVWKLNRILPIRLLQSKFKMHAFQHYFSLTLQQLTTLYYNTINFNCLNAKPLNLIKIRVPKHCFSIKTVSDTDDLVFTWWVFCIFLESRISNILAPIHKRKSPITLAYIFGLWVVILSHVFITSIHMCVLSVISTVDQNPKYKKKFDFWII